MSLTLATAVAAGLGVERCVWYVMGGAAALLFIAAVYVWTTPPSAQGREREVLDGLIRDGQAVRERIVQRELSDDDAREAGESWSQRVTPVLAEHFPAYVDAFRLARGDPEHFSGQALAIRTINAKLDVLRRAHQDVG